MIHETFSPAPEIPELDPSRLANGIPTYFRGGRGVPSWRYRELSAAFYSGLDLAARGDRWLAGDSAALDVIFACAARYLLPAPNRNRRLLIIGCGKGRLAPRIADIARPYRFDEFIVNDINPDYVRITANLLRTSTAGHGAAIIEAPGDIRRLRLARRADLAMSLFFVGAEICDLESVTALRAARQAYYHAISENLVAEGCLIEDLPERDWPGFYSTLAERSRVLLKAGGVADDIADLLSLSFVPRPGASLPYHVRCIPTSDWHRQELMDTGFARLACWNDHAEAFADEFPVPIDRRRIKRFELLRCEPTRETARMTKSRALYARLIQPTIAPPL